MQHWEGQEIQKEQETVSCMFKWGSQREKEVRIFKLFEELMAENFPKQMKDNELQFKKYSISWIGIILKILPFLDTCPWEMKTYIHTNTCSWMYIAALLLTANKGKQSRCPSPEEWINKTWYSHIMKYYVGIENSEILIHAAKCMNPEIMSENAKWKRPAERGFHLYDVPVLWFHSSDMFILGKSENRG